MHLALSIKENWTHGIQRGASVAVDGVCLTVVDFDEKNIWFDVIAETLNRTTLKILKNGQLVNLERSACFGDEIGGHILSGHIYGTAKIESIKANGLNCEMTLSCPEKWIKYFFQKGFIALNGTSLTLVDVDCAKGLFSVHLIPETLRRTTFRNKQEGDLVNVEIDSQTQIIVDTLERINRARNIPL